MKFTWKAPATIIRWIDGDTCEALIDLGWKVAFTTKVRLKAILAPEMDTSAGVAALAFVNQIAPPGTNIILVSHRLDKYGRSEAEIELAGSSLNTRIVEAGHAERERG